MEIEDLKKDDYYYAEYQTPEEYAIVKGTNGDRPNIYINKRSGLGFREAFFKYNTCQATKNVRLATPEEIIWLDTCIEQNRYISLKKALSGYYILNTESDDMSYLIDFFKRNNIS